MKNKLTRIIMLLLVLVSFTSCEAIGSIFKAGIGVGVFLVIAVVAIIIYIISRFSRRR
ncbi:MAG TPA: hypothetical protein VF677_03375 [Flavobacterium sp.]|jgi:hypothetical protein